jgi:hypothetical protein
MRITCRIAMTVLLTTAWAGCATAPPPNQALLTYESVPEGAVIFEGGQSVGVAPVTRTYVGDGKSDSIRTPEVTAVWPSGAKATFWTQLKVGSDRVATIDRPANAPGLQADLDNAKKLAAESGRDAKRARDALARDIARDSARCKDQMHKGNLATNDCQ